MNQRYLIPSFLSDCAMQSFWGKGSGFDTSHSGFLSYVPVIISLIGPIHLKIKPIDYRLSFHAKESREFWSSVKKVDSHF